MIFYIKIRFYIALLIKQKQECIDINTEEDLKLALTYYKKRKRYNFY